MGLRNSADFLFGPARCKIIPLNYDKSTPLPLSGGGGVAQPARGGVGPFDFSGVADPAAVEFKIKIDNAEDAVVTIDVSVATGGVTDESAVTVTEMISAITTAGYTGVTAQESAEGFLEIVIDTQTTEKYLQVYGEGAEIAQFGQGFGLQFIPVDTQQSISKTPTLKESETLTITDSNGQDTEVITDSFRKGSTGTLVDTARDVMVKRIVEGGAYDEDSDFYEVPTNESTKSYFALEIARKVYSRGTNKEADHIGWLLERIYTATADLGDDAGDRNFAPQNYNYTATSYKDPETGAIHGDVTEQKFSIAEFETFDWDNI